MLSPFFSGSAHSQRELRGFSRLKERKKACVLFPGFVFSHTNFYHSQAPNWLGDSNFDITHL